MQEVQVYNEVNSVDETENLEMDSARNSSTLVDKAALIDQTNVMVYNFTGLMRLANQSDPHCHLSPHLKSCMGELSSDTIRNTDQKRLWQTERTVS